MLCANERASVRRIGASQTRHGTTRRDATYIGVCLEVVVEPPVRLVRQHLVRLGDRLKLGRRLGRLVLSREVSVFTCVRGVNSGRRRWDGG